jgi:hypothetical protein
MIAFARAVSLKGASSLAYFYCSGERSTGFASTHERRAGRWRLIVFVLSCHSGQEGCQPIIQTMRYFIDLRIVKLRKEC